MSIFKIFASAFWSSDIVGKLILLSIIPVLSAILVGSIVSKFLFLRMKETQDKEVQARQDELRAAHLILGELDRDRTLRGNLASLGRMASQTLQEILKFTSLQRHMFFSEGVLPRSLTGEEVDRVMVAMENLLCKLERELDEGLHTTASIVTIAPLLGLFGTVWGVMATFMGIVENGGKPDIQAIAPGISGALLTTVAGLVVAIPGTALNNAILKKVQDRKRDMEEFCSLICASLSVAKPAAPQQPAAPPPPAPPPSAGMSQRVPPQGSSVPVYRREEESDAEA
ncbi:MAG: MotA/TolQ/ExbB proton channel family protein [Oligosphaeraceae bacterium]